MYNVIYRDKMFHVFEKATEQVIKSFEERDEAKKYEIFLKKGGGWGGWTPSFILNNKPEN